MDETLAKLGVGKDCDNAFRKLFNDICAECYQHYEKKTHTISENFMEDWSREECRTILREMTLYFLNDKEGYLFWSETCKDPPPYVLPRDTEIIQELLARHLFLYINDTRRKATVRRKILEGKGDSTERAIDIDVLSDDGLAPFVPASSPDCVPKR
jgi:hypothetical protein